MTLVAGARVGPYEVVSPLGSGGMGEVTKLMAAIVISMAPMQLQTPKLLFDGGFGVWKPHTPRVINWAEELKRLIPAS